MPNFRKLTPEEVKAIENHGKSLRKMIEEEYDSILSEYQAGEYGEAELDPNEKRLTVRNRLRAAALRRGLGIEFHRGPRNSGRLRFLVVSGEKLEKSPSPRRKSADSAEAPADEPKRRGRKKKLA